MLAHDATILLLIGELAAAVKRLHTVVEDENPHEDALQAVHRRLYEVESDLLADKLARQRAGRS